VIENLEKLTLLEELWLGKNKIRALEVGRIYLRLQVECTCGGHLISLPKDPAGSGHPGCGNMLRMRRGMDDGPLTPHPSQNLSTFSSLKILSLQSNRITKLENLEDLVNLEELYLSHNGLKKIEGLDKNVSAGVQV
jgi:Leucine-rich repeat (LRR) protein